MKREVDIAALPAQGVKHFNWGPVQDFWREHSTHVDWDALEAAVRAALEPAEAGGAEVLVKAADFPAVHRAQDIRLGVLAEEIDPLQGYVTKEDCARYVEAALAAIREGRG